MSNLAKIWKSQDRDAEALDLMNQYLELRLKVLGKSHPNTLSTIMMLIQ